MLAPATSHSVVRPARHGVQRPHEGTKQNATRSPGCTCVTSGATASTMPAPSCPSTIGQRSLPSTPSARCTSEWHTPAAATRTCTSPARGGSSRIVSISTGRPGSRSTAARTARVSADTVCLQRIEVGHDAEPGAVGRCDRAVSLPSRSAPASRKSRRAVDQVGGSYGTSTNGTDEKPSAPCRLIEEAVAVRPGVRRPRASVQLGVGRDAPAAAEPAGEHDVRLHHVDAREHQVARLVGGAHHLACGDAQVGARRAARGSRRGRSSAAAPRASTRRAARARARTAPRSRRPSAAGCRPACASPGWRRPSARSRDRRRRAPPRRHRRLAASRCGGSGSCRRGRRHRAGRRSGARARRDRPARRSRRTRGSARCVRRAACARAGRAPCRRGPRPRPRASRCGRRGSRRSRRRRARSRRGGRRRP